MADKTSIHSRASSSSTTRPDNNDVEDMIISTAAPTTTTAATKDNNSTFDDNATTITIADSEKQQQQLQQQRQMKDKNVSNLDNDDSGSLGMDIESGVPVKEEQTEEQILSQEVQTLPMRQLMPAFLGVALTMFMAALDNSIVSTALPRIGTEFAGSNKVELVFTCYIITANAFQVFLVVGIFVLGSILSGASRSMNMFLGCRALTGTGAGGIFSLANIIIADLVSIRDRGKYQGFISAVFGISALLGPVMGGAFVDKVSWRWCFYIQVALGAITLPTMAIMLKLPRPKGNVWEKLKAIDWAGTFFMAIFTIVEHETATAAGLTMIPLEAGIFISSNIAGILVSKYGKYRPYIFTGTGGALIGIGLCLVLATTSSKIIHVVILLVSGLGIGQLFPCLIVAIQASVERKDLATVSALHNFFRMSGSGFGVAINGALFQNHLKNGLRDAQVPAELAAMAISSSQKIVHLPVEWRGIVEAIYLDSMKTVFKATIPMAAIMFLLTFNLKHVRLNIKSTTDADTGSGTATPKTSGNDEKTMITNDATTATTTAAETTTTTTTTKANM
ncbi:hypothetical protein BX616_000666 [Lobosporangium transversale]|nr:hypothetical protein BX616_000666 [Lobosporangium transversale]